MSALVVVESMFGNTRSIAESVAAGLRSCMPVELVVVGDAPREVPGDVTLLLVGAPTHTFGMSRADTRLEAVRRGATASPVTGIRDWIAALPRVPRGLAVAVFDTKMDRRGLPGSAANVAARRLRRLGCQLVERPKSFYVGETPGPLTAGEEQRAEAWGLQIARDLKERGLLVTPA